MTCGSAGEAAVLSNETKQTQFLGVLQVARTTPTPSLQGPGVVFHSAYKSRIKTLSSFLGSHWAQRRWESIKTFFDFTLLQGLCSLCKKLILHFLLGMRKFMFHKMKTLPQLPFYLTWNCYHQNNFYKFRPQCGDFILRKLKLVCTGHLGWKRGRKIIRYPDNYDIVRFQPNRLRIRQSWVGCVCQGKGSNGGVFKHLNSQSCSGCLETL